MAGRTRLGAALLVLSLLAFTGCQSTTSNTSTSTNGDAAAALRPADRDEGGLLLRTGSIMLGPGVGRNQWRWLGDGQWGF